MSLSNHVYHDLLQSINSRIVQSQQRAFLSVNKTLMLLYWDIGRIIDDQQQQQGWGAGVIPRLSKDIQHHHPELKGFSERNIKRMLAFYREYPQAGNMCTQLEDLLDNAGGKVPQAVAQLELLIFYLPWGHNIFLWEKIKDRDIRLFYLQKTLELGLSRNLLDMAVKTGLHLREGQAITNFQGILSPPQSDLAQQSLKDPYVFDFLTLEEPYRERELENQLIHHLEQFLLELGVGFAFVGRQYKLSLADSDFYIDLLFYHLTLRCFVVVELKTGAFKPEYAGKLNFYCNLVDDKLKNQHDQPTIGLILCQNKNQLIAEYTLKGIDKPIGVSEYILTQSLPENLRSALPSIAELEAELGSNHD